MESLQNNLEKLSKENPYGFTVELPSLNVPTTGIVVAYLATQDQFENTGLQFCLAHAEQNSNCLGGWKNLNNVMQYDSCRVFETKEIVNAINFAKVQKQKAVFLLDNLTELILTR